MALTIIFSAAGAVLLFTLFVIAWYSRGRRAHLFKRDPLLEDLKASTDQ